MFEESQSSALSVSGALGIAKGALEGITVKILGEVSELSNKAGYKAVYFTVKDDKASLPCMMWNNRYNACGVHLQIGSLVEITGRFTLYAAKGRMNFDVFSIALAGEGNLRLQVANLAKKLQAEGLMSPARKRALPYLPQKVGLVTSPRGAAVYDVLRTLRRRNPLIEVLVAGVPVEGARAPIALAQGLIECANAGAEVILLVRGGGSFEDLMPFNDEGLARVIASCPVPVVTGIGHEPDTSIADMVADVRASTPTAAAETVATSKEDLKAQIEGLGNTLNTSLSNMVVNRRLKLNVIAASSVFKNPMAVLGEQARGIDYYKERLQNALPKLVATRKQKLSFFHLALIKDAPRVTIKCKADLDGVALRFEACSKTSTIKYRNAVKLQAARLEDLSPLKILGRGYSVSYSQDGEIIKSVNSLKEKDDIKVLLSDGLIGCTVNDINKQEIAMEFLEA